MSAHRWSILFLVLAGACVNAEAPGQFREASREDIGSHASPYSGPGSFSDASLRPIEARGNFTALFAPDKEETAQIHGQNKEATLAPSLGPYALARVTTKRLPTASA